MENNYRSYQRTNAFFSSPSRAKVLCSLPNESQQIQASVNGNCSFNFIFKKKRRNNCNNDNPHYKKTV